MQDEEFKQLLTKIADWELPIVGQNGGPAKPGLRTRVTRVVTDEFGEEHTVEVYETDENDTVAPRIKKLFPITKPCDDCGRMATDRKVTMKKHGLDGPRPHWRGKCSACGMHRNPWTGEFNIHPSIITACFTAYQREKGQIHFDSVWNDYRTPGFKPEIPDKN